jgi:integrase
VSDTIRVSALHGKFFFNNRAHLRAATLRIFPSAESKSGHIQEPKTAWKRILERAGLSSLRIHDLRRTCGSYQAIAGISLTVIGKSLGHKAPQSTAIYAKLSNDLVKVSMEAAFEFPSKSVSSVWKVEGIRREVLAGCC